MPFVIRRVKSSSDDALRERPRRKSTVPSPVGPWQPVQFAQYTSGPAVTSFWLYSPGWPGPGSVEQPRVRRQGPREEHGCGMP